jgi:hypothetical protein
VPSEEPPLSPDPATEGHRTPAPAPRAGLPQEEFVVVRPDVGTEVPTAQLSDTPPPVEARLPEPPAEAEAGLHDIQPRGLGAPLASPVPDAEPPPAAGPSDDDVLVAGVVLEPSDPDASDEASPPAPDPAMQDIPSTAFPSVPSHLDDDVPVEPNPFATDIGADLAADAASTPGAGDGMSWNDLAREFATDMGGAGETILPPRSDASLEGDIEPSAETEQSEPLISAIAAANDARGGPGSDASLGIGPVDDAMPNVQGLSDDPVGVPRPELVPTTTLVQRLAPAAVGVFLLLLLVWLGLQFLG